MFRFLLSEACREEKVMPLNLAGKRAIVEEVATTFANASAVIAAEYAGLTVAEITELRIKARERSVKVQVVRNTLARLACKETEFECLQPALVGPVALVFSMEEASAGAKVVRDFLKGNDKLQVKAIALDGELLGKESLETVASLPTLEEARAMLVATLRAPATHLLRTLQAPTQELLRVMPEAAKKEDAA